MDGRVLSRGAAVLFKGWKPNNRGTTSERRGREGCPTFNRTTRMFRKPYLRWHRGPFVLSRLTIDPFHSAAIQRAEDVVD
jgi:hypothetical protein